MLPAGAEEDLRIQPAFQIIQRLRNQRLMIAEVEPCVVSFHFQQPYLRQRHEPAVLAILNEYAVCAPQQRSGPSFDFALSRFSVVGSGMVQAELTGCLSSLLKRLR